MMDNEHRIQIDRANEHLAKMERQLIRLAEEVERLNELMESVADSLGWISDKVRQEEQ